MPSDLASIASALHDPRLTPARGDIAARHLEGRVSAERFVAGEVFEVRDAVAPVRARPSADAMLMTEALLGERVTVYDRSDDGWAWGQLADDFYVGWLPSSALAAPKTQANAQPTHRVTALRTFAFPGPSIKLPPLATLVLGSVVTIAEEDGIFAVTSDGRYLPKVHIGGLAQHENDFVAVAERFVGTPYLWGGKSSLGVDCSGLTQIALQACAIPCLRDSDMQEASLGHALENAQTSQLQRGDLIFWKGHVAIVRDSASLIHGTAQYMQTVIEPITEAIDRINEAGYPVTTIRRLSPQ